MKADLNTYGIRLFSASSRDIAISESEALRYLGYPRQDAPDAVMTVLMKCREELRAVLDCKACYTVLPIELSDDDGIKLGDIRTVSHALCKNLSGCEYACLFAATTGVGVDRLIARNQKISVLSGIVTDALASAAIEGFCDLFNSSFSESINYKTRPRFSPGYGDLSLSLQSDFLRVLCADRRIGLQLTSSVMMTPTKSVTALIGIENNAE